MQIVLHSFNRYELSEEEQRAGAALTLTNQAVVQNLIAGAAEQKLHLNLDPQDMNGYVQQEAYLRGQIDVLTFLLDQSKSYQTQISE